MDFVILQQLGVALALATLIGLERERRHQLQHYEGYAGIRTFALIGLLGALAYIVSAYSLVFFSVITAGFLALLIAGYVLGSEKHGVLGMTSEVASILVYIIGILSAMKMYVVATAVALVVFFFLLSKDVLHRWAKRLKDKELVSTLEFMIIAFLVLPLLPNQSYGPYDFFNPYVIWLIVVFVSGISLLSYIAIKSLGTKRGLTLTGFLSGFISTTALAFSFSSQSKKNIKVVNPYLFAMVVASTAMFFRIVIEVAVLNSSLILPLLLPMVTISTVGAFAALFIWWRNRNFVKGAQPKEVELKSPFSLLPALKFAVFFASILFLTKLALALMGDKGIYVTSFLSGLVDVDAITVSMANLAKTEISHSLAVSAITIAAVVNTLVKGAIFFLFGNKKVALKLIFVYILMALAGILIMFLS